MQVNETLSIILQTPETNGTSKKNKLILILLEATGLSVLGIDRFYLGDTGAGVGKLCVTICTCGVGGAIWGIIDSLAVLLNCLQSETSINTLGMHATFESQDVQAAHTVAVIVLLLWIPGLVCCACACC